MRWETRYFVIHFNQGKLIKYKIMDEELLQKICNEVSKEQFPGMGVLSDQGGLYSDFAKEVAKKYFERKSEKSEAFKAFFNGIKQEAINHGRLNDINRKFEDCSETLQKQVKSEFEDFKNRQKWS